MVFEYSLLSTLVFFEDSVSVAELASIRTVVFLPDLSRDVVQYGIYFQGRRKVLKIWWGISYVVGIGMAQGVPRYSFPEVLGLFSLPDSPRNIFYHYSAP